MAKIATTQKKNNASKKSSPAVEHQEVAKLAYQFYIERGCQHGFDKEDWGRAEKIIKARKYNS